MPAKTVNVNLLGSSDLMHTPWGRIVSWVTTYGRYIMITTEIVVLLAFVSRFSLDRKLTDLEEEIRQKETIVEANAEFETEIRLLQDRLTKISDLISAQPQPAQLLTLIHALLPADTRLSSFNLTSDKLTMSGTSGTNEGFSQFLSYLRASQRLSNVAIGGIHKEIPFGIQFEVTVDIGVAKKR